MEGSRSLSTSTDHRYIRQNSSEILSFLKQGNPSSSLPPPGTRVAPFDPSEFPSLGRSSSTSSNSGNSSAAPLPLSVVVGGGLSNQRHLISNDGLYSENFPALPQTRPSSSLQQQQQQGLSSSSSSSQPPSSNPFTQAVHQQQQMQHNLSSSRHDLTLAGNFGLMGLMGVIRMEDPDRGSLALGTDLTNLGLNLNSTDQLHTIFSGPWDDTSRETLFSLPASYPRKCTIRPEILEKVNLETLFVCFYSMPRDVLQVLAAQELVNRGWRFHEELRLWFSQAKNGSVVFFDVHAWERRLFSGRLPDGFESGFLSPDVILSSSRLALSQLQQQQPRTVGNSGSSAW